MIFLTTKICASSVHLHHTKTKQFRICFFFFCDCAIEIVLYLWTVVILEHCCCSHIAVLQPAVNTRALTFLGATSTLTRLPQPRTTFFPCIHRLDHNLEVSCKKPTATTDFTRSLSSIKKLTSPTSVSRLIPLLLLSVLLLL